MPYVRTPTSRRFVGSVPGDLAVSEAGPGLAIGGAILAPGAVAFSALAIPIAGAVAAAGILIYSWIRKRNAQKVAATSVVNEAEPYLKTNRDAFLALPNPTAVDRDAALQYFGAVWAQVQKECRQIGGGGGDRCVSDRVAGSCVWKDNGACWNWFSGYRDPIANTAVVVPQTVSSGSPSSLLSWLPLSVSSAGGGSVLPLLGLALVGGALMIGNES